MAEFTGTPRECVIWLMEQDGETRFEIKQKRKRRSLTQNAYYWAMLNQLARKLRISDTEVHKQMLREYGVCDVVLLRADIEPADYFKYYDAVDAGTIKGVSYKQVRAYKRSSRMDSAEFSCLVDGMRYECEQQGIDVMTPEEIASLRFVEPKEEK